MKSRGPLDSATMFGSAGCFATLLLLIAAFTAWNLGEHRRILEQGRKTTVTVLEKRKDIKGKSPTVRVRLDERPSQEPFERLLLGEEWDRAKPGDTLPYVYEEGNPTGGVLGTPSDTSTISLFAVAASVFVAPFVAIGVVLRRRERRLRRTSGAGGA